MAGAGDRGTPRLGDARPAPAGWPRPLVLVATILAAGERRDERRRDAIALADRLDALEWGAFVDLVIERHRVAPLVAAAAPGLGIPEAHLAPIRDAARRAALGALAQKAETARIVAHLQRLHIDPVLLKGWALAERLYGSAGMREGRDIDLLALDRDFDRAAEFLRREGYSVVSEAEPIDAPAPAERVLKDLEFSHPDHAFTLELHARSNAYRGWPGLTALENGLAQHPIDQTGIAVRVPSPRGDLVYLSVHGMQHVYSRLRWLHDIATLIGLRSDAELAGDLAAAARIEAARFVRISVGLAHSVFGSRWPTPWQTLSISERLAVRTIMSAIAQPDFAGTGRSAAARRIVLKLVSAETLGQRLSLVRSVGELLLGQRRAD